MAGSHKTQGKKTFPELQQESIKKATKHTTQQTSPWYQQQRN
jgi:hypothetical protein